MGPPLKIEKYIELAKKKKFVFILKKLPVGTTVKTILKAWKCIGCNEIIEKSYNQIKGLSNGCRDCDPISSKKKTINDYKVVGKDLDIIWDETVIIPNSTEDYTDGFICPVGHKLYKRYKDIRDGHGCSDCSNVKPKTINDYHNLAKDKDIKFLLDKIPKDTITKCNNAWECKNGHIESATYHTICQSTYACVSCAGNKPKEFKDYVILAEQKEFKFILDKLPEGSNTDTKIEGWRCKDNHIFIRSYHEILQDAGCDKCNKFNSEKVCIEIFEELLGIKFVKCRPKFLGGKLELDGYNKEYKIGIEYNGEHHYEHIKYFHDKKENFDTQQENDKKKIELCKQNDVLLFIIPYTYNYRNKDKMREYIKTLLNDILLIELPIQVYKYFCKNKK